MVHVVVKGDDPTVNPSLVETVGMFSKSNYMNPLLNMIIGPHYHIFRERGREGGREGGRGEKEGKEGRGREGGRSEEGGTEEEIRARKRGERRKGGKKREICK